MEEKTCFGPLTLDKKQKSKEPTMLKTLNSENEDCDCMLCDKKFTLPSNEQNMLTHLFMEHRLVIADVNQIADLKKYLDFWKHKFQGQTLAYYCTTMLMDEKPDGIKSKNEKYYLLSDVLPEDKEQRTHLQQTRLEQLLALHKVEREDNDYEKECLFCRFSARDTRANYLKHLYEKHNFHIAKPENLVFVEELVDLIGKKLDNLQCIFCEKTFEDRSILKEHMRKKGHKRINPFNKEYDRYFLVNYLEPGSEYASQFLNKTNFSNSNKYKNKGNKTAHKTDQFHTSHKTESIKAEDQASEPESDPDWSDWDEPNEQTITCLFCEHIEGIFENILKHMSHSHSFDFEKQTDKLSFYHKIKVVNYVRRQIHILHCVYCDLKFESLDELIKHMKSNGHFMLKKSLWDQPEFFFPTYEDDLFLCFIQDNDESWWSGEERTEDDSTRFNASEQSISERVALAVLDDTN